MGWDRQGARLYYSRSRKVAGRVIREYVGGGAIGELAAAQDARRREQRQAEAAARRQEESEWQARQALLLDLHQAADLLLGATLVADGYHRHGGEWRRHDRDPRTDHRPGCLGEDAADPSGGNAG